MQLALRRREPGPRRPGRDQLAIEGDHDQVRRAQLRVGQLGRGDHDAPAAEPGRHVAAGPGAQPVAEHALGGGQHGRSRGSFVLHAPDPGTPSVRPAWVPPARAAGRSPGPPKGGWSTPSSTSGCAPRCPRGPGRNWTNCSPTCRSPARPPGRPPSAGRPPGRLAVAFKSSVRRAGRWRVPEHYRTVVYKGNGWLDLRAAELTAAETTLLAVAYKSRITVLVPPGIRVEASGFGADTDTEAGPALPADAPVVHVRGFSYKGTIRSATAPRRTDRGSLAGGGRAGVDGARAQRACARRTPPGRAPASRPCGPRRRRPRPRR